MIRMSFFILLASLVMPFAACAQLPVGRIAPEIRLPDSLGKWKPLSDVKGKIILLDFWAAWCDPCIQSMPELKRLYNTYHDKGLDVYAVSVDKDYRHWVATCRRLELPFILVNDAYGLAGKVSQDYLVTSIPNKMLLKDGKILGANMSLYELEKLIIQELK